MKVRWRPLVAGILLFLLAMGISQYNAAIEESSIIGGPGPELSESTPAP